MENPSRLKDSLQRFDYALGLLRQALERGANDLNQLETEGTIRRFEYCLRMSWRAARDYLEESGMVIEPATPRESLRQAAATKIVRDGQVWIDMLNHRTLLAHSYDGVVFGEVMDALTSRYFLAMEELHSYLAARCKTDLAPATEPAFTR